MMRPDLFPALMRMDDQLARAGIPPISDRWREELKAFYGGGYAEHAARVGRGGSKSTTSAKCLTAEVLFGDWKVPPGERHWAINISENLAEATSRLGQIASYLDVIGVPYDKSGEQILLRDLPLGFWSRPARIGAVSGPRAMGWSIDEQAKLDVDGQNPAEELAISLRACSVTHPAARGRMYSSPWSTLDYHHQVIARGTTPTTLVSVGPSWEFNPAISQARTRELAPDPVTWSREYGAVPMRSTESAFFDFGAIELAVSPSRPLVMQRFNPGLGYTLFVGAGADFAFTGDSSAIAVCHRLGTTTEEGEYSLAEIDELQPSPGAPLRPSEVCARFALVLRRHGCRRLYSDSWQFESVSEFLETEGIGVDPAPAGNTGKVEVYTRARTLMHQGIVTIPQHKKLIAQLQEVVSRPTTTGLSITSPRKKSGHGDLVSAFVLALWNVGQSSSGYQVKLERLHEVMTGHTPGVDRTNKRWADKARADLLHTAAMTRTPEELAAWRAKHGLEDEGDEP